MKRYEIPNVKFVGFDVEDIITQSGVIVDAGSLMGEDKNMYQVYEQNSQAKNTNISVFTW